MPSIPNNDPQPNPPAYEERLRFRTAILSKAFLEPTGNTTYEEIVCVGFQPELNRLEAVVHIKQPVGYGGDVCSTGTPEYVRFFLSLDGGKTWHDEGVTGFTAYDIPAARKHPIEYAVTLTINPRKHLCLYHNFALVRAILSWDIMPTAGKPNFRPHWGNHHETTIQIAPARRTPLSDVLELSKVALSSEVAQVVDAGQEITTVEPKELTLAQLAQLYRDKKVEAHRFGFAAALDMADNPKVLAAAAARQPVISEELGFDVAAVLEKIAEPKGDTAYEQLDCVGLDPVKNTLVATFRVKQGWGYSGGPCTHGSLEYVTFWADFDRNGTFEKCLGTVALRVHDFEKIPAGGLEYAVSLPVHLAAYAQPCTSGPKLVPIRAMLSWNRPHSCRAPGRPPVWGNAVDTVIQIPAGPPVVVGKYDGYLYTVCEVNICDIDPATGLTRSFQQPFGATLDVTGEIPAAPAITTPGRFKYRVWYQPLDPSPGGWAYLINPFSVWVTEGSGGGIPSTHTVTQTPDASGWYPYLEYGTPITGNWRRVTGPNQLLGAWVTGSARTGRWQIGVEFQDTVTNTVYWAGFQNCPDGSSVQNAVVYLDQVAPSASLSPDLAVSTDGGATWQPAKQCDTLTKGVLLKGSYSVSDEHFRVLNLYVEPTGPANGATVTPASRSYGSPDFVPTTGETGTWQLDTTKMDPCGYVIRLDVWDRTIVSCDADGWFNWASIGFCLKAK